MAWWLLALFAGCGIKRMLPGTPVLEPLALSAFEDAPAASVTYEGPHRVDFPVLPLQVFGLYYDVDIVMVSRNSGWDMHEYARVSTPEGPVWLAKDSRPDGVQTITADRDDIAALVAEVPIPRLRGALEVADRSTGDFVDLDIAYTNPDGLPVRASFRGPVPDGPPRRRNGSTMGHSRQAAAVVLDLERFGSKGRAAISIGGQDKGVKRLFGILPMRYLLWQDQGGIAVTSFRQEPTEAGFHLRRPAGGDERDPATGQPGWPTARDEDWTVVGPVATWDGGLSRFAYTFSGDGLARATVTQYGRKDPTFDLWLRPALPDLSRPFEGEVNSRFRMDVNGQKGHGTGTISARWLDAATVEVTVIPTEPWWLADRPMVGTVHYPGDGSALVQWQRTED